MKPAADLHILSLKPLSLFGCFELRAPVHRDNRGLFVKTYQEDDFRKYGLHTEFQEEFYTVSKRNVLRGLHFQIPPKDHVKLVHCIVGSVLDAVVDLRIGSPTYGQFELIELSEDTCNSLYIPPGIAHGFYVRGDSATLMYKVSTVHSPAHDTGIRWNSVGIPWPTTEPIVSDRDRALPEFKDFNSPFIYRPE